MWARPSITTVFSMMAQRGVRVRLASSSEAGELLAPPQGGSRGCAVLAWLGASSIHLISWLTGGERAASGAPRQKPLFATHAGYGGAC